MSFNINNIAGQAFQQMQVQGFGFAGAVAQTSPFQAAQQMLSSLMAMDPAMQLMRMMQGQTPPMSTPALPSPTQAQLPTGQGGFAPSSLGQFQQIFQQLGQALQQLRQMSQFSGFGGMINGMNNNFAQVGQTGMFSPNMMTNPMQGGGMMNQFANVGNLMGFAAGGFMMSGQIGFSPSQLVTETKDKYAGLKAGMGNISDKTNLAQLPEAKIALNEILKKNPSMSFDKVAETLKKDYGIEAKSTKIDGKSALEITTPDGRKGAIVDGNGNNALDSSDYKFKDAAGEVMKQYGLENMDPKQAVQTLQMMAQPQMGMQFQMMGAGMMGGMMGGMGGISDRAQNPMALFGNMLNPNAHNTYGTFQNNNFLGGYGQNGSGATGNFFFATSQFAMLAAEANNYLG